MGHQIFLQPNGRLAVFSTDSDDWIIWDATADEIVEFFAEQAADEARVITRQQIEAVLDGRAKNIYTFAMTLKEADDLASISGKRLDDLRAENCLGLPIKEFLAGSGYIAMTTNTLLRRRIELVRDLVKLSEADLLRIHGLGVTSVNMIKERLAACGQSLRSDV